LSIIAEHNFFADFEASNTTKAPDATKAFYNDPKDVLEKPQIEFQWPREQAHYDHPEALKYPDGCQYDIVEEEID
jgi:hypothetical protein